MTPRLKTQSGRDVVRALRQAGFEVERTRGSHATLSRRASTGEKQILTVPLYKELAPGTLHAIYRQALKFVPPSRLRRYGEAGSGELLSPLSFHE